MTPDSPYTGHRQRRSFGVAVIATVLFAVGLGVVGPPAVADGNEAPGRPAGFRSIAAGSAHTCAVLDDATIKCWGANGQGQLGRGSLNLSGGIGDSSSEMGDNLPTVDLGTGRTATAVTAGESYTCALLDDRTVKCWGDNASGQLGLEDTADRGDQLLEMGDDLPAVNLGSGRSALAISAGYNHTCALLDDRSVKCWGYGNFGRLGQGDNTTRGDDPMEMQALPPIDLGTGRTAVSIAAGGEHTCALLDDASVKCWGANGGELGQGDTNHRGDGAGEMGDNLPAINLGSGRTARAVATGAFTTCALLDNGAVKCWGYNTNGELGVGDMAVRGDGPGEMGDLLPAVQLGGGRTATAISAGQNHTCALLDDDTLKCWGGNNTGQLGQGDTASRGDGPGEMGNSLPAIALSSSHLPVAMTTGASHTCVVLDDETLKCWGLALSGRLGLGSISGSFVFRGDQANEMGDVLPVVNLGTDQTVGPRAQVHVALTAGVSRVVAGENIGYQVTVTNIGGLPLTRVQVDAPDVADCDQAVPNLAPAGTVSLNCTYTTTDDDVPLMTNQVLVRTAQGAFDLSGTRRTRVDPVVHRPDGQIRLAAGAFAGDGVYNTNGAGQTRTATVANLGTATFTVRVQNDGNTVEAFTVQGLGSTSRYTVTYKNLATNITTQVVAGTFTTLPLAPGATQHLTLTIKAKAGTPVGNALSRTVTVTSQTDPTAKDAVKATVTRR